MWRTNKISSFLSCIPYWLIAALLLFLPLLFIPMPMFFGNWDAVFYSNILSMVSDSLTSGRYYPRWLPQANAGFGSPVMLFYAPLGYLLTALLNWPLAMLHPSLETQFIFGIAVAQILSGLTAWLWLKENFTLRIALVGSLAYMLLPYKFIYIYEHFNLAQLWALVFLPLWMISAEKLAQGRGVCWSSVYALMLAAVYYTHPLTVIAFAGVPLLYVVWLAAPRQRIRIYIHLLFAHLLAAGLCLMQALPQLLYRGWIHEEGFLEGRLDWRHNLYHIDLFLCAYYGIIAALGACGMAYTRTLKSDPRAQPTFFWAFIIAAVALMNLPLSSFLWEHVPLLKFLQFPAARLHCAALMGVVYLICVWLAHGREMMPLAPLAYGRKTLAALIILFSLATLERVIYNYSTANDLDADYVRAVHAAHIIIPPEYKTRWDCILPSDVLGLFHNNSIPAAIEVHNGEAKILLIQWRPPEKIFFTADVESKIAEVNVRQCYFPLWQASDNNMPVAITPAPPRGVLQLSLPKGHHAVTVSFVEIQGQRIASGLSLLTLLVCLLFVAKKRRAHER